MQRQTFASIGGESLVRCTEMGQTDVLGRRQGKANTTSSLITNPVDSPQPRIITAVSSDCRVIDSRYALGPYEITALIGEGGMGKVWRAHHTALNRDDALKVLPEAFASDPDRLARFRREAQVLASLNHPNIAHVYGLEKRTESRALVMELVEGRRWRTGSRGERYRSTRRCRSRGRSPMRSTRRTKRASSIAI